MVKKDQIQAKQFWSSMHGYSQNLLASHQIVDTSYVCRSN